MMIEHCRADFPIFKNTKNGKPLVYLDSAASSQKPLQVVNAISDFYIKDYANIHRGIYHLSERATERYEASRSAVAHFINAHSSEEIIFVKGTTDAINLVASSYGDLHFKAYDEIILSEMEHHSNIVPWLILKDKYNLVIKTIPVTTKGELNIESYQSLFTPRTKLVAVAHASNVLGSINPVQQMVAIAHQHGVPILLDGAQAVPHLPVDVQAIDCDFYAFSAHKLYGPTGIGVLYAKQHLVEQMQPYQGGGGMIEHVSFEDVTFAEIPNKFEAGTPNIAGAIGLHAAINYITDVGMDNLYQHEQALLQYAQPQLLTLPNLRIIGTSEAKVGVISFVVDGIHAHDLATILDDDNIAVRAGHHCAKPLMEKFQLSATVRASFGLYNNKQDVDALIESIKSSQRLFA